TIQVEQERLEGWKTRWRIEQSLPPHPALSPGERENLRTRRQGSGNVGFDPTHRSSAPRQLDHHRHDRTPWRTRPFQMCRVVLPLPWGEGGVRGKRLACRLRLSFQPLAPVSIPPKIAWNQLEYPLWMMRMPQVPLWKNPHRRRVECSSGTGSGWGWGEGEHSCLSFILKLSRNPAGKMHFAKSIPLALNFQAIGPGRRILP